MIKLATISSTMTAGAGTLLVGYCIEVPTMFGATSSQPSVELALNAGTPFVNGSSVVIPCTATVKLKYINQQGVVTKQQELTEHFDLGTNGTALPETSVLNNLGQQITYTQTKCCRSFAMRIDGSMLLTTTAA